MFVSPYMELRARPGEHLLGQPFPTEAVFVVVLGVTANRLEATGVCTVSEDEQQVVGGPHLGDLPPNSTT